jgi:hypothetical protein
MLFEVGLIALGATVFGIIMGVFTAYNGRMTRGILREMIEKQGEQTRELIKEMVGSLSKQHETLISQQETLISQNERVIKILEAKI